MIPCFPRHARRIRLEWRTVRSIVKRILVTCAATTALALLLTMVLCALGNAMAPKWQVEPFTDHITLTTTNTAIQAVDPATGAVLKTPQEGAYRTKETHITVALDGGKTVNAIVREPLDAPADRPACLFLHGSGTGKSSEAFGDVANAMASAGITTLVPDKRLEWLRDQHNPKKFTPAVIEFVDIAGLVKGASRGEGLGNKFLANIRGCDAIVHVVRCFDDDNIIHVVEDVTKAEAVDPIADIDAIDYELILSDLEVVQNRAGRMAKAAKSGNNKGAAAEAAWLQQLAAHLESGKPARSFDFDENDAEQQTVLHEMGLLSAKPVLYACNVGEDDLMEGIENNKYVPLVAARAKEEGARYIPICAKTEEDIADYSPEEKKAFLAEMGIEASGLDNLITASYDLLGLISFLTDGKKECRAWTIRKGTKAPQAAGKIHSDFERGFIRASVIGYNDLEANNFDYAAVKAKGLQRTEGKEYVVQDGDVIEFLFNV